MPPAGRRPKPAEQKRKLGNPGKRSLPDRATLVAVAPVDAEVGQLTPLQCLERGLAAGKVWLGESDAPTIGLALDALELYAEARSDPKAKLTDVVAAGKWVQSLFGDLGFTPAERARLGLAEVKAVTKVEELLAKQAANRDSRTGT
jgi:hypothetical protein